MEAFVREVFSTTQLLMEGHVRMLDRLLERQRQEWPLVGQTYLQDKDSGRVADSAVDHSRRHSSHRVL